MRIGPRSNGALAPIEDRIARACDGVLDAAVWAFAGWTLIYDACLVLGVAATVALLVWLALLAVLVLCRTGLGGRTVVPLDPMASPLRLAFAPASIACALVLATSAATIVAVRGAAVPWTPVWLLTLSAVCLGAVTLIQSHVHGRPGPDTRSLPTSTTVASRGALAVLLVACVLGGVSLFMVRPDADDVYYVNRSTWVADNGTFALVDTIFSHDSLPAIEYPPVSSIEGLVGAAAHATRVSAADITYFVVPPIATTLAVLALWRLVRTWRTPAPAVAVFLGLLFLVMGGTTNASFGNLFLGRMWQGKVMLLTIALPLLLVHLDRWVRHRDWQVVAACTAVGVGAVGLSSTAVILVPLVVLAGATPLLLGRRAASLLDGLCVVAYPLAVGIVIHLAGGLGGSTATARDVDPSSVLVKVFDTGAPAALALLAVLVAWISIPSATARVTVTATGITALLALAPGVLPLANRLTGAGPVLWRVLWLWPVAALVGTLVMRAATGLGAAASSCHPAIRRGLWSAPVIAAAVVLLAGGRPLWSTMNGAVLASSPRWKVDANARAQADGVLRLAHDGDVVLAPIDVSAVLAIETTRVVTVDPRADYIASTDRSPAFHAAERRELTALAEGASTGDRRAAVTRAIGMLDVRLACIPREDSNGAMLLITSGFRQSAEVDAPSRPALRCFVPAT